MLALLVFVLPAEGYNILLYNIRYGYSHMNYIGSIADTLQAAGHNVTVIQPEVDQNLKSSGCNLARVILVPADENSLKVLQRRRDFEKGVNMWTTDASNPSVVSSKAPAVADIYAAAMQNVLNQKGLMAELRAVSWDLGLFELLDYGGYPVLYEAGVKNIVGDVSVVLPDRVASILGLPQAWSFVPALQSSYSDDGSFTSRLFNLAYAYYSWEYERIVETAGQRYMDRHHPQAPKIWEVVSNMSVVFTNGEPLLDFPRPTLHKVVDLGGIILKEPKKLNQNWEQILTERKTTVLISFGTLMKSSLMPVEYKQSIVEVIKRFPEVTFIWKYETPEDGTGQGVKNLHLSKWIPQTDLLASGMITLFVGHGGAGGVIESSTHGVPMIVNPIFGDQYRNSRMIERFGNGMIFNKLDLASADKLEEVIRLGLADKELHSKARLAKDILAHRPFSPQEKLLRHVDLAVKFGANLSSFSPSGRHFNIVQFYNLDIFSLALGVGIAVTYIVTRIISSLYNLMNVKVKQE